MTKQASMRPGFVLFALVMAALTGCARQTAKVLGTAPPGVPNVSLINVSSIVAAHHPGATKLVTMHGVMTEKCPIAGCWFRLRDHSGTIKVDTKAAGFTVLDVPLQTEMTVSGTLVSNGNETMIQAASVRY